MMKRSTFLLVLAMLGAMLFLEYTRLTIKPWPAKHFEEPDMHFKYGSIGAEVNGYPFLIWRELPTIFADRLPEGYRSFGFNTEAGQDLPVGVSVRRYGINRVGFNCATCHVATYSYQGETQLVYGAPAGGLNLQAYIRFLYSVSIDPRLTPEAVFESAEKNSRPLNFFEKLVLSYVVFPRISEGVAGLQTTLAWMENRPDHGPGRTDAGNFWRSRWELQPEDDEFVGVVDHPSIWNQQARLDGWFHWDGNNASLDERNYSAAQAGGASDWLLEKHSIGRVSEWLNDLPPPQFPAPVDTTLAETGRLLFVREACSDCHDIGADKTGQVTPVSQLGTDPERVNLFSPQMVRYFSTVGELYSWQFKNYRVTDGYANMPLDGIWMRGPYLHNGSVPSLADLLNTESERPSTFYRGCDTLDVSNVGFTCRNGFLFDTELRGNSNSGHEYGVNLSTQEKLALIEYMKTL